MKFYVQSANLNQIRQAADMGLLDGVVLCRSDVAREGADYLTRLAEICALVAVPVSAEVLGVDRRRMVREAESLYGLACGVMVKLPTITPGLKACKELSRRGHSVHMTLCFQPMQALAAAKAGAAVISLHIGQVEESAQEPLRLVRKSRQYHETFGLASELMACGIDGPEQLPAIAAAGADAATIGFDVLERMVSHPLTESAVREMMARWHPAAALPRISA